MQKTLKKVPGLHDSYLELGKRSLWLLKKEEGGSYTPLIMKQKVYLLKMSFKDT